MITGSSALPVDKIPNEVVDSFGILLLEAGKMKASVDQLKQVLVENGIKKDRIAVIEDLYNNHLTNITRHLEYTAISFPSIVGVEWRLDYSLRSKHGGKVNMPLFFVSLQVNDNGVVKNIDLICTREELLDMLAKVKDAVKQVEKVMNMSVEND